MDHQQQQIAQDVILGHEDKIQELQTHGKGAEVQHQISEPPEQMEKTTESELDANVQKQQPASQQAQSSSESSGSSGEQWDVNEVKPKWDPRPTWLRSTDELLNQFNESYKKLTSQKEILDGRLKEFEANKIIALKKVQQLQRINKLEASKTLSRKLSSSYSILECLHVSLVIQIFQFVGQDVFLVASQYRRVSRSFNSYYLDSYLVSFCVNWYIGLDFYTEHESQQACQNRHKLILQTCIDFVDFKNVLLYYKSINYTKEIPHNSFKNDLVNMLKFINCIHKYATLARSVDICYFQLLNKFLLKHQALLALEVLCVANIPVLRVSAIHALINHLAFNPSLRTSKTTIPKPVLSKLLTIVEDAQARIPLVFNTRIVQDLLPSGIQRSLLVVDEDMQNLHKCMTLQSAESCTVCVIDMRNLGKQHYKEQTISVEYESETGVLLRMSGGLLIKLCLDPQKGGSYVRQDDLIFALGKPQFFLGLSGQSDFKDTWVFSNQQFMILPFFHN